MLTGHHKAAADLIIEQLTSDIIQGESAKRTRFATWCFKTYFTRCDPRFEGNVFESYIERTAAQRVARYKERKERTQTKGANNG